MSDNSTYNLTEYQKCQLIDQHAMYHSESTIRKRCFEFRIKMILKPFYQFLCVLIIGMVLIIMPIVSVIIVSQKFKSSLYPSNENTDMMPYSSAVYPLIAVECFITLGLIVQIYAILIDIFAQGLVVWNRDNLGIFIQNLILHSCLLSSLFKLKYYISLKEEDQWTKDEQGDGKPDFFYIFYPLFWCIGLYFFKISCIKTDHVYLKVIMGISVIFLAYVCESHFDRNRHNDAPLWLLSIPLSIFLVCQALLDWFFLKNN